MVKAVYSGLPGYCLRSLDFRSIVFGSDSPFSFCPSDVMFALYPALAAYFFNPSSGYCLVFELVSSHRIVTRSLYISHLVNILTGDIYNGPLPLGLSPLKENTVRFPSRFLCVLLSPSL